MAGKSPAPAKPELAKQGNGMRVIRYPFKTKKGTTVARNYKLGWPADEEALRLFGIFREQWGKMNGAGPEGVIATMNAVTGKKKTGTALKVLPAEDAATLARREKQRTYARESYRRKKAEKNAIPNADLERVTDLIGVIVGSLGAINSSMKMLQDMVISMQRKG